MCFQRVALPNNIRIQNASDAHLIRPTNPSSSPEYSRVDAIAFGADKPWMDADLDPVMFQGEEKQQGRAKPLKVATPVFLRDFALQNLTCCY